MNATPQEPVAKLKEHAIDMLECVCRTVPSVFNSERTLKDFGVRLDQATLDKLEDLRREFVYTATLVIQRGRADAPSRPLLRLVSASA